MYNMTLKCDGCKVRFNAKQRTNFMYDYDEKGKEVVFCTPKCKKSLSNLHEDAPNLTGPVP